MRLKILITGLFIFALLTAGAVADTVIKEFSGSGPLTTRPFDVSDKWEIQWNSVGERDMFAIKLRTADGEYKGLLVNNMNPVNGSSYQPKGGSYYLEIEGGGNWEVKIVEVD